MNAPHAEKTAADSGSQPSKYIKGFDGLRAIAVLMVVACHLTGYYPGPADQLHGAAWLAVSAASRGYIGVDLFFVLSGFLITGILLDKKSSAAQKQQSFWEFFRNFSVRRGLRIIPLYVAYLGLAATAIPAPDSTGTPWWAYITLPLPHQNWWFSAGYQPWPMTGHTWSLAVEEQFYCIWPVVVWVTPHRHLKKVVLATIITCFLSRFPVYQTYGELGVHFHTITRMDAMALGALCAILWRDGVKKWTVLAAIAPAALAASCLMTKDSWVFTLIGYPLIAVSGAGAVMAVRANQESRAVKWLEWWPLRMIGEKSFGIYVLHDAALIWAIKNLSRAGIHPAESGVNFTVYVMVVTAATVTFTAISWQFEAWCLSFKDRLAP